MRYAAAAFPPLDFLPASAHVDGPEIVRLLPVRTATRDWGILAVCGSVESRAAQNSYADVRMWATLLGVALDRESLLGSLAEDQDILRVAYEHRLITENIHELIFVIDPEGYYLYASPSFQHVLGYRPLTLLGTSMFDLVHPDDLARVREQWAYFTTPVTTQAIFRARHADGGWRWLEASGTVVVRQGAPSIIVVGRDITERKRLEAHILQSQKMESIGWLAGGVAHDFNNLLTAITGYAELVLELLAPADPVRGDMEEIQKAAQRATSLTRQLLAFARKQIIEPRVLNLNDLILDMDRLLRRLIGEDIELMTLPAPNLKQIKADSGQIEQLLVNLAVNARDAMPRGGRLTIETANVFLDATYARAYMSPGSWVMLTVSDSGIGMDAEVQAHLFEPFFTTKGPGKGTGLGLATCYGIVQQHGGSISVYSEVGLGTTIKILLPSVEDSTAVSLQPNQPKPVPRGMETVLVVEDEPAVRALAVRVLGEQGYIVLEAADGTEALRMAEHHTGTIDLLLTDVVMPQISGKALADRLIALRPGIKVLFMSGYTDNVSFHHDQLEAATALLWKPFSTSALVRKVRDVLDA
jgi:PAS domain S-box-containing protein